MLVLKESQLFAGVNQLHLFAAGVPCKKNGKAFLHTIPVRPSSAQGDNCSLFSHRVDLWDLAVMLKLLASWTLLHCPVSTPAQGSRKRLVKRPGSNPGDKVFPWN